jgi:divalent metal cation (Fe/Co/Zn/Cd) transporter
MAELPIIEIAAARRPVPSLTRERYAQLAGRAKLLSWVSLGWMTIEGAVAVTAGIAASSIALVGFGLDSVIEGVASVIIVWRFTGNRVFSHTAEQRAQKLVAVQFFLLAPYVGFESVKALAAGEHPDVSWVGIGLSVGSVIFMPMLGIAKQRLADQLGSAATAGEGRQNMLCAYLAAALLVGLLGNALVGAWWLDPGVGLLIAAVAVREGVEAWRGEGCCVSSPLDGVGFKDDGCQDECCSTPSAARTHGVSVNT